ncbi:MAG: hypothetical protein GTO66_37120 [Candidatus Aminicenantes bacterium]|nr:hypothetical protein [Candidatus Aminicenantes bacterium]NIN47594.1 hypothetical protein [Candidatus Aminicenantes bacterium]
MKLRERGLTQMIIEGIIETVGNCQRHYYSLRKNAGSPIHGEPKPNLFKKQSFFYHRGHRTWRKITKNQDFNVWGLTSILKTLTM